MEHTVQSLIDYHKQRNQSRNPATLRNEISALKQFLKSQGISLGSPVPACFGADGEFNKTVNEYLEKAGFPDSTAHSKRTCLKNVRESYLSLIVDSAAPKNFPGALSYYIEKSGMSYRALDRAIGRVNVVRRWANGKQMPSPKSTESVRKLEKLFELPPGTLQALMPCWRKKPRVACTTSSGQHMSKRRNERYGLSQEKWPEKCIRQFEALARYKEADILPSGVLRHKSAVWRREKNNWRGTKTMHKEMLALFWGYLIFPAKPAGAEENPQALFGQGMAPGDLGLENFLDPSLAENYINFMRNRSNGGHYNTHTEAVLRFVSSLVHPEHGFIWQHPSLFPDFEEEELKDLCAKAHARYTEIRHQLSGKFRKTRDPEEPIRAIIQHEDPLSVLIEICERAQNYAEVRWAGRKLSVYVAVDFRNALFLGMMRYMPLRAKNYCLMTWKADNTGHLNKRNDGSWWLDIPKEAFKNERGAAGDRPYSVQISKTLWGQIEFYLQECRPLLLKSKKVDYLFLSRQAHRLTAHGLWELTRMLTRTFCPPEFNTPGFGPHAFRHLVATGTLKDDPSAVETVATVLHDRVETVRKNYAHLLVKDGQDHFNKHMEKKQRKMEDGENNQEFNQLLRKLSQLTPAERAKMREVLNA